MRSAVRVDISADLLRQIGLGVFGLTDTLGDAKVLVIVDDETTGVMAACTELDRDEIRGLMYRAGQALPEGL
jgi:hypothetical protein